MDIFVNRQELIKRIFPMGTDDLGHMVRADDLYEIIMGMPEHINMARNTSNKNASAGEAIIALALARTKLSEADRALPIEVLRLSARINNGLSYAGITTLGALVELDMHRLKRIRNLGSKGLAEIQGKITSFLHPLRTKDDKLVVERKLHRLNNPKRGCSSMKII